jgi:YesN/AraC family two-component response regulator
MMYKAAYERLGFRVITAARGRTGLKIAATKPIDVVITDFEMPGMDGAEVAMAIKTSNPQLPVIMFSGSCFIPDRIKQLVDGFCD